MLPPAALGPVWKQSSQALLQKSRGRCRPQHSGTPSGGGASWESRRWLCSNASGSGNLAPSGDDWNPRHGGEREGSGPEPGCALEPGRSFVKSQAFQILDTVSLIEGGSQAAAYSSIPGEPTAQRAGKHAWREPRAAQPAQPLRGLHRVGRARSQALCLQAGCWDLCGRWAGAAGCLMALDFPSAIGGEQLSLALNSSPS